MEFPSNIEHLPDQELLPTVVERCLAQLLEAPLPLQQQLVVGPQLHLQLHLWIRGGEQVRTYVVPCEPHQLLWAAIPSTMLAHPHPLLPLTWWSWGCHGLHPRHLGGSKDTKVEWLEEGIWLDLQALVTVFLSARGAVAWRAGTIDDL